MRDLPLLTLVSVRRARVGWVGVVEATGPPVNGDSDWTEVHTTWRLTRGGAWNAADRWRKRHRDRDTGYG